MNEKERTLGCRNLKTLTKQSIFTKIRVFAILITSRRSFPSFIRIVFQIKWFLINFLAEETPLKPFVGRKLTFYRNLANSRFSFWAIEPKRKCHIDRTSINVWCTTREQLQNDLFWNESDYKVIQIWKLRKNEEKFFPQVFGLVNARILVKILCYLIFLSQSVISFQSQL